MNSFPNKNATNMSQESTNSQHNIDSRKFLLNKIKSSDNCLPKNSSSSIKNIKKQQSNNELVSNVLSSAQRAPGVLVPNPIKLNSTVSFKMANEIEEEAKASSLRVNLIESEVEQSMLDAKSIETDQQNESDAINQSLNNKLIINNESKKSAFRPFKSKKQSSHSQEPCELRKACELSSTSSAASSSSSTHNNQSKTLTSTENSSESKEMAEIDVEDEQEEADEDHSAPEDDLETKKPSTKRSAFAWVGKKMAKRVNKKPMSSAVAGTHHHNHHNHQHHQHLVHLNHHSNHFHHHTANTVNSLPSGKSKRSKSPSPSTALTENESSVSSVEKSLQFAKKSIDRIDWTENAKQGTHFWSDLNSQALNTESCYLNDTDVLEFHDLDLSIRCQSSSGVILLSFLLLFFSCL